MSIVTFIGTDQLLCFTPHHIVDFSSPSSDLAREIIKKFTVRKGAYQPDQFANPGELHQCRMLVLGLIDRPFSFELLL